MYSVSTGNCHVANMRLPHLTIYNRKTNATLRSNYTKSNCRIMFMRYLNLAILATTVLSQSAPESTDVNMFRKLDGDFTWDYI
jgi:hypothetical protein